MKLLIDRVHVEELVAKFPRLVALREQLRFGNTAETAFEHLETAEVDFLIALYQRGGPDSQVRAAQLATLQGALNDNGTRFSNDELEEFVPALARFLLRDPQRGWLFGANASVRPLPYVVTRVDFTPANSDETAKVFVELKANAKGSLVTQQIRISSADIAGKTIAEVLAAKGFIAETADLIRAYDDIAARYFDWRSRYGAQFSGRGVGFYAEDPNASHRDTDWSRKDIVVLSTDGTAARLVNDEGVLTQRHTALDTPGDILGQYLRKAAKSNQYDQEDEVQKSQQMIPPGMFTQIPVHPYILMFHLELHHYLWVHVEDMKLYEYRPDLKQKLVLPEEQTDLIDILTAEMDVLMDDIVAGKSGGTTVLCAGPPGVGKTLTAEVYSEIIRRPLYRVHSGQLGLNVASMEASLKAALMRAQRWGAVMLIDEADVYIRRRNDDISTNAVVGVFLRVLEYYSGLLFLTTNRVDDIDEAIVSRCIALIRYSPPDDEARLRIWEVMLSQFELTVESKLVHELVQLFPDATGRDIKGLTKLVAKYCRQRDCKPTLPVFKRCAIFRGMEQAPRAEASAKSDDAKSRDVRPPSRPHGFPPRLDQGVEPSSASTAQEVC
ncbi:MAG TPA: ATP-binding protein [Polyangiaceae bacterium]|nr:ATP-binding protein [Polyangiaceae bacterium]